jgi:hypothetical protein
LSAIGKRVGRDVENAHDQGAIAEGQSLAAWELKGVATTRKHGRNLRRSKGKCQRRTQKRPPGGGRF